MTKGAVFDSIVDAGDSGTSTGSFNNNLSGADDTVQKSLDTIDNLTLGLTEAGADAFYVRIDGTSPLTANWNMGNFVVDIGDLELSDMKVSTTIGDLTLDSADSNILFGNPTTSTGLTFNTAGTLAINVNTVAQFTITDTDLDFHSNTISNLGALQDAWDMNDQPVTNINIDSGRITGIIDLAVSDGGTGASSFTDHGVLLGSGAGAFSVTAVGTATHVLTSNGSGSDPTFQAAAGGGGVNLPFSYHMATPSSNDRLPIGSNGNNAITITKIWAKTNTGTIDLNIQWIAKATVGGVGTNILTSTLVADSNGEESTDFSDATIPANSWFQLQTTGASGSPGELYVTMEWEPT